MRDVNAILQARKTSDFSVHWARAVVRSSGGDANVLAVSAGEVDAGTTARVRVSVAFDRPCVLPTQWFVKFPSTRLRARGLAFAAGLTSNEFRFYRTLALQVPVLQPICIAAAANRFEATIVMGDLNDGSTRFGSTTGTLSIDEVGVAVETLARMHARFCRGVDRLPAWLDGPMRRAEDRLGDWLAVPLMRRGLKRAGKLVPRALHDLALRYARSRRAFHGLLNAGPRTLVHRDCHPGNWFFRNGEAGLLDWQLTRAGVGVGDVAYLLATGLEPGDRKVMEEALLCRYAGTLQRHDAGASLSDIQDQYRRHLLYAFEAMVVTLAIGGMMPLSQNRTFIKRTVQALIDNNALEDARLWPSIKL
jgi:hypothetical protein